LVERFVSVATFNVERCNDIILFCRLLSDTSYVSCDEELLASNNPFRATAPVHQPLDWESLAAPRSFIFNDDLVQQTNGQYGGWNQAGYQYRGVASRAASGGSQTLGDPAVAEVENANPAVVAEVENDNPAEVENANPAVVAEVENDNPAAVAEVENDNGSQTLGDPAVAEVENAEVENDNLEEQPEESMMEVDSSNYLNNYNQFGAERVLVSGDHDEEVEEGQDDGLYITDGADLVNNHRAASGDSQTLGAPADAEVDSELNEEEEDDRYLDDDAENWTVEANDDEELEQPLLEQEEQQNSRTEDQRRAMDLSPFMHSTPFLQAANNRFMAELDHYNAGKQTH
jgi:hypothetical protein